MEAARCYQLRI